jgi:enoyl-CoA hydratase/carnithine racemase
MTEELIQERHDTVLLARINRPEARNAINGAVLRGLADAVTEAESSPEIRALVVTGSGDRAFCAGMDLRAFAESGGAGGVPPDYMRLVNGEVTVPVLAAVNGFAVGGGCEITLGCDVIVASHDATFALPEVKRGLFPGVGLMHIAKRLPMAIALELALTGERIDAARAYDLGFVNRVVPPAEVLDTTLSIAQTIAANAPLSLAAVKELIRLAAYGAANAEERLAELQQTVFTSADAREGATAFVEKRPPVWQGR